MAARVVIDFENVYQLREITPDFKQGAFGTRLESDEEILLSIRISSFVHELLPNVYNLAFGPLDKQGRINDRAELTHIDYSKVFSTILLSAYTYLKHNMNHYLGVDGSDNNRAYFYYRALIRNINYLNDRFNIFWYQIFCQNFPARQNTVRQSI